MILTNRSGYVLIKTSTITKVLVGHNIEFDINIIGAELIRANLPTENFLGLNKVDTGIASTEFCQLQGGIGGKIENAKT
ncbi:MAG: hypothetical protein QM734_02225 [Cyclobacteriaceae bacterium]